MKFTLPLVLLEVFVVLGLVISGYTIHLEHEIEKNRTDCKTAKDCKTCSKLPAKASAQCIDSVCWGLMDNGFICKGRADGFPLPGGGECNKGKQYVRCPEYVAMCDLGAWSKCSKVFTSPWSHILVHWGIAAEGSMLDLTLPVLGSFWFVLLGLYPFLNGLFSFVPAFYSLLGAGSLCFNGYLGWVLKTKLQEFCIVCFSTYVVNCSSVVCVWCHWRATCRATHPKAASGKSQAKNGKAKHA